MGERAGNIPYKPHEFKQDPYKTAKVCFHCGNSMNNPYANHIGAVPDKRSGPRLAKDSSDRHARLHRALDAVLDATPSVPREDKIKAAKADKLCRECEVLSKKYKGKARTLYSTAADVFANASHAYLSWMTKRGEGDRIIQTAIRYKAEADSEAAVEK